MTKIWKKYPEGLDLLRRLRTKKEEERINCDDIIKHAWFKSVNFGKVENKEVKAPIKPKLSHKEKQLHNVDTNIIFQNGKNNAKNSVNNGRLYPLLSAIVPKIGPTIATIIVHIDAA